MGGSPLRPRNAFRSGRLSARLVSSTRLALQFWNHLCSTSMPRGGCRHEPWGNPHNREALSLERSESENVHLIGSIETRADMTRKQSWAGGGRLQLGIHSTSLEVQQLLLYPWWDDASGETSSSTSTSRHVQLSTTALHEEPYRHRSLAWPLN